MKAIKLNQSSRVGVAPWQAKILVKRTIHADDVTTETDTAYVYGDDGIRVTQTVTVDDGTTETATGGNQRGHSEL